MMDPEKVKQMFAEMDLQGSIDRARCKRRQKKLDATARQYFLTRLLKNDLYSLCACYRSAVGRVAL